MIPGLTPVATIPVGSQPLAFVTSVTSRFAQLFNEIDPEIIFLVEISPYDGSLQQQLPGLPAPVATLPHNGGSGFAVRGGERVLRVSNAAEPFITRPDDTSLASTPYPSRLSRSFSLSAVLFSGLIPGETPRFAGSEIQIINEGGEFDQWTRYSFDGRDLTIKAGLRDFAWSDFGPVAALTLRGATFEEDAITLSPRDQSDIFRRVIQQNLYGGMGGADGDASLKGRAKPLGFGAVSNAPLLFTDQARLIGQLHDGSIQSVLAVRDQGVALTPGADHADYATLEAAIPAPGSYDTCLALGFVKLGSIPSDNGEVTADFEGDNDGGYVSTIGSILRRIVTTRLGNQNLADPAGLDAVAFAELESSFPATAQFYAADAVNAEDVLNALMRSAYGYWFFTRAGQLSVGLFTRVEAVDYTVSDAELVGGTLRQLEVTPPAWRVQVGWGRVWTVQTDTALAGSVSADQRQLYGNEYRHAVDFNSTVRGRHRFSQPLDWPTLLVNEADAIALAARIIDMAAPDQRRFALRVLRSQLRLWLASRVGINAGFLKAFGGALGHVVAINEDYDAGYTELEIVA